MERRWMTEEEFSSLKPQIDRALTAALGDAAMGCELHRRGEKIRFAVRVASENPALEDALKATIHAALESVSVDGEPFPVVFKWFPVFVRPVGVKPIAAPKPVAQPTPRRAITRSDIGTMFVQIEGDDIWSQGGWYASASTNSLDPDLFQGVNDDGRVTYDGCENDGIHGPFPTEAEAVAYVTEPKLAEILIEVFGPWVGTPSEALLTDGGHIKDHLTTRFDRAIIDHITPGAWSDAWDEFDRETGRNA